MTWQNTSRGQPPTITGCALEKSQALRFKCWLLPNEEPKENALKKMFTEGERRDALRWRVALKTEGRRGTMKSPSKCCLMTISLFQTRCYLMCGQISF